MHGHMQISH